MLSTEIQLVFTIPAAVLTARFTFNRPAPEYPPAATGDHGAVAFLFTVAVLGGINIFIGFLSVYNWFNRWAEHGHKRRFLRYTSFYVDVIFMGFVGGALAVSRDNASPGWPLRSIHPFVWRLISRTLQLAAQNLGDGATNCLANTGPYHDCLLLMIAVVMVGLVGLMAFICFILEFCRRVKKG